MFLDFYWGLAYLFGFVGFLLLCFDRDSSLGWMGNILLSFVIGVFWIILLPIALYFLFKKRSR